MIPTDSQTLESYLPVYDAIPKTWEEARPFIVEQLKKISDAVNIREIGWFLDEELLSGKAFIPGSNDVLDGDTSVRYRTMLRKVIDFGPLPAAGVKSVPHGIVFDNNFTLIQIWASATDPIGLICFPIPYADPNVLANAVLLTMDAVNVNIGVGINRTNYTRCFVIIEYTQEL